MRRLEPTQKHLSATCLILISPSRSLENVTVKIKVDKPLSKVWSLLPILPYTELLLQTLACFCHYKLPLNDLIIIWVDFFR